MLYVVTYMERPIAADPRINSPVSLAEMVPSNIRLHGFRMIAVKRVMTGNLH
jgi:hypothetical protein